MDFKSFQITDVHPCSRGAISSPIIRGVEAPADSSEASKPAPAVSAAKADMRQQICLENAMTVGENDNELVYMRCEVLQNSKKKTRFTSKEQRQKDNMKFDGIFG